MDVETRRRSRGQFFPIRKSPSEAVAQKRGLISKAIYQKIARHIDVIVATLLIARRGNDLSPTHDALSVNCERGTETGVTERPHNKALVGCKGKRQILQPFF